MLNIASRAVNIPIKCVTTLQHAFLSPVYIGLVLKCTCNDDIHLIF